MEPRPSAGGLRRIAPAASLVFAWLYYFAWNSIGLLIALPVLGAHLGSAGAWGNVVTAVAFPFALHAISSWPALSSDLIGALVLPVVVHAAFKWSRGGEQISTRRVGWLLAAWGGASLVAAVLLVSTSGAIGLVGGILALVSRACVIALYLLGWLVFGAEAAANRVLEARSRPLWVGLGVISMLLVVETVWLLIVSTGGLVSV